MSRESYKTKANLLDSQDVVERENRTFKEEIKEIQQMTEKNIPGRELRPSRE